VPLKVLIVPDKFKGTLTAGEAADAIARGWHHARPRDALTTLPMSDGGDGFGEVMSRLLGAGVRQVKTVDTAHRPCRAQWWWEPKSKTAVIESAGVIGLALLPPGRFHPFALDTFGLAAGIRAASTHGARRCFIGIGGSATNDGGFGLARALGWKFIDRAGNAIERWIDLRKLARLQPPERRRWFDELIVAVDVQNPLLGVRGATRVYGPQKGLKPSELVEAERNLRRLAQVVEDGRFGVPASAGAGRVKRKLRTQPGAGAAGGLGFGLLAFLGARAVLGFDLVARAARLDRHLHSADLVVTGEGDIDRSTFMGKGAGQVAQRCRRLNIPCLALAGAISDRPGATRHFTQTHALTDLTTPAQATANPALWLERLAQKTAERSLAIPA